MNSLGINQHILNASHTTNNVSINNLDYHSSARYRRWVVSMVNDDSTLHQLQNLLSHADNQMSLNRELASKYPSIRAGLNDNMRANVALLAGLRGDCILQNVQIHLPIELLRKIYSFI